MNQLYLSIPQRIKVDRPKVHLGELAQISISDEKKKKELESLEVCDLGQDQVKVYGINEIIDAILNDSPDVEIINLGEIEFIVQLASRKKPSKITEMVKLVAVTGIIFFGAAFSIMTFNEDASVEEVMQRVYLLIMGKEQTTGTLLEVSYSIGLSLGIITFYNHMFKKKKRLDPTPIQVEMRTYEKEVNETIIINADRESE